MRLLREAVRAILLESVGKTYFHGRRGPVHFAEGRPAFFAENKEDAEWYAHERGLVNDTPTIYIVRLSFNRPASYQDLKRAVEAVGASEKDISGNSPYYGDNFNDYVYVPQVQRELERLGFDAVQTSDILTNDEVPIVIVWHPRQIQVVASEKVEA